MYGCGRGRVDSGVRVQGRVGGRECAGRVRALRVYGWEQRVRVPLQQACGVRRRAAAETGDRAWCSALRGRLAGGRVGVQEGECVSRAAGGIFRRQEYRERRAPRLLRGRRAQHTECRGQRAARLQTTSSLLETGRGLIRQGLGVRVANKGRCPN